MASRTGIAAAVLLFAAGLASADAQTPSRRSLGAHQHGIGTLSIVIEDQTLAIELEVSAIDIVGFETQPKTPEQEAELARAEAILRDPAALFTIPPAANCRLREATVERETAHPVVPREAAASPDHLDIHVKFDMACASTRPLTTLGVKFFELFPRTESFLVRAVGRRGQGRFAISRVVPRVDLARVN